MTNNIDSLRRYTKEELLFGIGYACTDTDVRIITSAIERKRMQDDLEKEWRLLRESNDALTAYSDFMRKLAEKYGDGKSLNLGKVPLPEIEQAAELETIWQTKEKQWRQICGIK